jgi:hypothetical protein
VTRRLVPYFGTLFFVLHVVVALVRGGVALEDPSTGWHLAAGRLMLETGAVPRVDDFSFTATGREWLDYYWLWQLASGWLERAGGLALVATVWMLVYALVPFLLYRTMIRAGASPLAAFVVLPLAYMVTLSHALARPHVVTYVFFALLVARLDDVRAGRVEPRALWWVPLMAIVWVNVHGGFVLGLGAVAAVAAASGLAWLAGRDPADRRHAVVCLAVLVAMTLATLANPYGVRLHEQVVEHLGMPSTALFDEFRSPDFRTGALMARYFELLVLGVVAVSALGATRITAAELALVLLTLHGALTAVRNMSFFAIVAAPIVARGVTAVLEGWRPALAARWREIAARQEASAGWRVQLPLVATVVIALALAGRLPFPATLDDLQLSRGAVAHVTASPARFARAFNTIGLGGPLVYRFWPRLRVFVDDRTPVYGERFVDGDYLTVLFGRPGWQDVLDRWQVTAAIVTTWAPCEAMLRAAPGWAVDYADARITIFIRTADGGLPRAPGLTAPAT